MGKLSGKSAVVTGASAGIGQAIAELYAKEGASVVAVARRGELLEKLARETAGFEGTIAPFTGDMREKSDCTSMIDFAIGQFGGIDILVNNAGVVDDLSGVADVTDEMFDNVFRTNTYGPLYATRKAIQEMIAQGRGGVIINIASLSAAHPSAGVSYGMSKAAVVALTTHTGFTYAKDKIRCNAIAPGSIASDIALAQPKPNPKGAKFISQTLGSTMVGGTGTTEDVAQAALYLASDEARYINGAVINVDGGWGAL